MLPYPAELMRTVSITNHKSKTMLKNQQQCSHKSTRFNLALDKTHLTASFQWQCASLYNNNNNNNSKAFIYPGLHIYR